MKVSLSVVFINTTALLALMVSFIKSRDKTKMALKAALKGTLKMLPAIIILIILVGILLGFFKPEMISKLLGSQSGFWGIALASIAGSILMIPSLIAFPLTASLVQSGASIAVAAAFITTLTMIGFVTIPIEIKTMGKRFTILRNGISFLIALGIALIMGAVLK